ncbi:branched-chain amino acid ABC transporter permease, partial [Rhizobiaceae sp. 2RAB30]
LFIAIRGLGLGAAFTAIALSLNVIYRATHILNFAQGGMFVLGGLLGVLFSGGGYGTFSWLVGLAVSGAAMGILMGVQGAITLW